MNHVIRKSFISDLVISVARVKICYFIYIVVFFLQVSTFHSLNN